MKSRNGEKKTFVYRGQNKKCQLKLPINQLSSCYVANTQSLIIFCHTHPCQETKTFCPCSSCVCVCVCVCAWMNFVSAVSRNSYTLMGTATDQPSNTCPTPCALVRVCARVCVCVWGGFYQLQRTSCLPQLKPLWKTADA